MKKLKDKISQGENQIVFCLKTGVFPLEAIYGACYVFIDRAYVFLDGDPKKEIIVSLKGREKLNKKQLKALSGEFHNELLNYLLRVEIAKRNKKIRDFIVGTALVSALPTELLTQSSKTEIAETANWQKDPLGIVIPWEEKYGKKAKKRKAKK